jgi:hypothetical protein
MLLRFLSFCYAAAGAQAVTTTAPLAVLLRVHQLSCWCCSLRCRCCITRYLLYGMVELQAVRKRLRVNVAARAKVQLNEQITAAGSGSIGRGVLVRGSKQSKLLVPLLHCNCCWRRSEHCGHDTTHPL